jgi:phosphoglycolate phosphatase
MDRKLIIFDCDGTLVDSQHLIVAAMERAFHSSNRTPPERDAILGIVGLSLPEAIWRLTDGEDEETVMKIRDSYRDAFGDLRQDPKHNEPMYEGAREAILQLAQDDQNVLGIATGKSRRGVDKLLERFDLTSCFSTIQTADDAPSKPHPGMISQAIDETGAQAAHTIMIGDTTFDMEMAVNAGVMAIGVSWGYHPVHLLREHDVHAIADNYTQLMTMLDGAFTAKSAAE